RRPTQARVVGMDASEQHREMEALAIHPRDRSLQEFPGEAPAAELRPGGDVGDGSAPEGPTFPPQRTPADVDGACEVASDPRSQAVALPVPRIDREVALEVTVGDAEDLLPQGKRRCLVAGGDGAERGIAGRGRAHRRTPIALAWGHSTASPSLGSRTGMPG